ncbi:hypothetical protein [Rufibacter ruber]|uniref:hypothetical protein n=1 Tax=Rufibacter ruber TaxID=1783499 RepID=UPI00128FD3FA|nr:hypothetical protein [Rufibacter ruber]
MGRFTSQCVTSKSTVHKFISLASGECGVPSASGRVSAVFGFYFVTRWDAPGISYPPEESEGIGVFGPLFWKQA